MKPSTSKLYQWCFAVVMIMASAGMLQGQTIFYVKKSGGNDGNTGTSWNNAFQNLNKALEAANAVSAGTPVEIRVAAGVYKPTEGLSTPPANDRDATFLLTRGDGVDRELKIFAGYPETGGETRNYLLHPAYLDGDIGTANDNSDNSINVCQIVGLGWEPDSLVVDGFTIRNGNANGAHWRFEGGGNMGGGLFFGGPNTNFYTNSKVMIRNCTLAENNASDVGGAVFTYSGMDQGYETFANCRFINNTAEAAGAAAVRRTRFIKCTFDHNTATGYIGAVALFGGWLVDCSFTANEARSGHAGAVETGGGTATITGTTFTNNKASGNSWSSGGAINIEGNGSANISGCIFKNNTAEGEGGAIRRDGWGYENASITNCYFEGNEAGNVAGAVLLYNTGTTISNSFFKDNKTTSSGSRGGAVYVGGPSYTPFSNLVFVGNTAANGGAIYENDDTYESVMSNLTFAGNTATDQGGGFYNNSNAGGQRKIINSIFWDNTGGEIYENTPGYLTVSQSIVKGGYAGTGNLDADPFFRNAADPDGPDDTWGTPDDGLQLLACSPAVDAGTSTDAPLQDILGNARFNGDGANGAEPDLGAYESQALQNPPSGVIAGTTEICPGASTNLTVNITNGTAPFSVVYTDGTTQFTVNSYTSGSPVSVSPSATATYTLVSITDAEKCEASALSGSAVVTVLTTPSFTTTPADINADTDEGQCSAVVNYTAQAAGGNTALHPLAISYAFTGVTTGSGTGTGSGAAFNKGETTVTLTASNGCAPDAVHTFKITVNDNENPTITAPSAVSATTNTGCTATGVTLGTPVTADNCSVASVTNNAPTAFPLGATTVTWTVTDGSGNTATATQIVTVTDNVPPTITAPVAVSATTNTGCTATGVTLGTPVTADNCSVASVTNNAPTAFPLGATTVTWTVTDGSGNTATATQTVTVTDNVPPTITAPSAVSATTNTGCTATGVTLGTPVTADNCSVASVTNNAPTAFPLGATTVTWTVTDGSGNTATAIQTVTVTDNVPPTITAPSAVSATTNTGCTATGVTLGTPVTADNCSVASVTNNAPTAFPLGATTVTWTVTDGSGNTATATQTVTVTDNIKPAKPTLADATGECSVTLTAPTTSDNCAGIITGTTTDPLTYTEQGTYTVTWTFNDGNGNTETAVQTVIVQVTQLADHLGTNTFEPGPGDNTVLTSGENCKLIASVTPGTVSGQTTFTVFVDGSVQTFAGKPYVQRHYDISPATNGTGRVTLYFTQEEFDAYNSHSATTDLLPTGQLHTAGISNLRINQFHGTGNPATGAPGSYPSGSVLINPDDNDIVWNGARGWWEVTFDVTGFSGFFVTAGDNSALPVTLSYFEVTKEGASAHLTWATTSETNFNHFDIERSPDAKAWKKIGEVKANNLRSYTFTDPLSTVNRPSSIHYYRLKITDLDGTFTHSPIRSLKTEAQPFDIRVYPNPASRYASFGDVDISRIRSVVLYNLSGQKVLSGNSIPREGIRVEGLPSGVYHIQITGSLGEMAIRKLVIGE